MQHNMGLCKFDILSVKVFHKYPGPKHLGVTYRCNPLQDLGSFNATGYKEILEQKLDFSNLYLSSIVLISDIHDL